LSQDVFIFIHYILSSSKKFLKIYFEQPTTSVVLRKSGARQTGKSTLLTRIFPQAKAITFDPIQDLFEVRKDPDQFLQLFPSPLILDEVQFVPELLSSLKRKVDQTEQMGQYFLTGSQNFQVLSSLAESMAGRVAIFHLDPFSPLEMQGLGEHKSWVVEYLRDPQAFFS